MKLSFISTLAVLIPLVARTQTPATATNLQIGTYTVIEQGPNHRVWQRVDYETTESGYQVPHVHTYRELATGLNYWDTKANAWAASQEQIVPYADGGAAVQGQHKVYFPYDLSQGILEMATPDGLVLKSQPLCVSYYDGTHRVIIAALTTAVGQLVESNQVLYPSAFTNIETGQILKMDLLYTYKKGGFEQDLIIRQQPPAPEAYGLDSQNTRLELMTEFFDPPAPRISATFVSTSSGRIEDHHLTFGAMIMPRGRAFLLGTNTPSAPVLKQWLQLDGRRMLLEQVPVPDVQDALSQLPLGQATSSRANKLLASAAGHAIPARRAAGARDRRPLELAKAKPSGKGLVLDYITVNGSQSSYLFQGDTTYYISGPVTTSSGLFTFEGGAVLKYAQNASITVNYPGSIQMLSYAYHPVAFTAVDDNSIGDSIHPGASPFGNYYANPAIAYNGPNNTASTLSLSNFVINFAYTAVSASGVSISVGLNDGQIVNSATGFSTPGQAAVTVQNVLFSKFDTAFSVSLANITVQNCTFDGVLFNPPQSYASSFLLNSGDLSSVVLGADNCIFANVTYFDNPYPTHLSGDKNGFYNNGSTPFGTTQVPSSSNPFQTVKGGGYYLSSSCNFQQKGSVADISTALIADLRQKTTYPPVVYPNTAVPLLLSPQATRDPALTAVDLGFHYCALDYIFGGCVANANVTLTAGTAAGWFRSSGYGISLANGILMNFNGTEAAPNYWVRLNNVQEQDYSGGSGPGGIVGTATSSSSAPTINARFTRCGSMGSEDAHFASQSASTFLNLNAIHCEFSSGSLGYSSGSTAIGLTNCLSYRCEIIKQSASAGDVGLLNCTMWGGQLKLVHAEPSPPTWQTSVRNCSFDGATSFTLSPASGIWNSLFYWDFNALSETDPSQNPEGAHDIRGVTFSWQTGPLGVFYLQSSSPTIQSMGDQSATAYGLGDFTTQEPTPELPEKQKSPPANVDIGYHYVALGADGNALDTDHDGIPDWWADLYQLPSNSAASDPDGDGLSNLQEFQLGSNPFEHDDLVDPLALPPVGAAYLRILTTNILELVRITAGSDNTTWNYTTALPLGTDFTIKTNGISSPAPAVTSVGYKRRPLYYSHDTTDLRVENTLYLVLSDVIANNSLVEVLHPTTGGTWGTAVTLRARNNTLRYGPTIHVNHEGYPAHVNQGPNGPQVPAPQRAVVGYYCGSITPPVGPSINQAYYWPDGGSRTPIGGSCYGPLNLEVQSQGRTFDAFAVDSFSANIENNFGGWVGCQFIVGPQNIQVTKLARWVVSGNSQNHTVKLVDSNGNDVPGGSVTVSTAGAASGQFAWADLVSPVTLTANLTYYIFSHEVNGGDSWYNFDCSLSSSILGQIDFSTVGNSSVKLVDAATGATIPGFSPTVTAATDLGGVDSAQYQGMLQIDLGGFSTSGEYRLQVDGLGASFPFRIGDEVPMKLARTYALGLYHQRCGSASGTNYSGGTALPITRITGSGTGATITPTIAYGTVTGGTIPNGGSGWNAGDTFTFADPTGSGFVGTVATVTGGPGGALATFTVHQINELPFTRFTHGNCHIDQPTVPMPWNSPLYYGAPEDAWNIIASWGSGQNSWQTAQQLVSGPTMLFPFSQTRGAPLDNGQEVVAGNGSGKPRNIIGGHHDAGDYSRYTINSANLIHTLIFAVDNFSGVLNFNNLGIPESGSTVNALNNSDLLAEAKREADFLYEMQDRGNVDDGHGNSVVDGGFFTLTYPQYGQYEDYAIPDLVAPQHIVWPKTTSVTAAAVAALAEIGSSPSFVARYPNDAQNYITAATYGWNFLMRAIAKYGKTGAYQTLYSYGDVFLHDDELAWAAAAMFAATGNPVYDTQLRGNGTTIVGWYPDPTSNNPVSGEKCDTDPSPPQCGTPPSTCPNAPCRQWWYGWWQMYQGYGCAVRDYAFAVHSGRRQAADMNSTYLGLCQTAAQNWGHTVRSYSENNAYGTSLSTSGTAGYGWHPEFYFPGYWAFEIAVADQLDTTADDHKRNAAAVLGSLNFELGCNPNNVGFLPGLGWRRQRVAVSQYEDNARRIFPPTGNPIGSVNDYTDPIGGHPVADTLNPYFYPPAQDGNSAGFALYDRTADASVDICEFVGVQTARSLATAAWLAAQSTANLPAQNPWTAAQITAAQGTIAPSLSALAVGTEQTVQLNSPNSPLPLASARIVWDLLGVNPAFGQTFTFTTPNSVGENRLLQAEAVLQDGRRIFASSTVAIYDPVNGGTECGADTSTVALYHFNTDLTTDSGPHTPPYTLTVQGNPTRANNTTWMNQYPNSGYVARFSGASDYVQVNDISASSLISGGKVGPVTIEAWIYPRSYNGAAGQGILFLKQDWSPPSASQWGLFFDANGNAPDIWANASVVLDGASTSQLLSLNTWHKLVITFDGNSATTVYIDGTQVAQCSTTPCSPIYDNTTPWTLTIGNFDGDIDEVRISNCVRGHGPACATCQ